MFVDRLARVLPQVDRDRLTQAFHFTIALMVSCFAGAGRIDALKPGELDDSGLDVAIAPLITYTTAGFLAMCGASQTTPG